jgi:LuxR family transcriptional regulator, maltose regulon positive regulatory protein
MRPIAQEYRAKLLDSFAHPALAAPAVLPQHKVGYDIEALSARELEVLRHIAEGASNREIAGALFVSLGTVKRHLNNIFIKLDAHSRTQTVAIAKKQNFL